MKSLRYQYTYYIVGNAICVRVFLQIYASRSIDPNLPNYATIVVEPGHFGTDPDPWGRTTDLRIRIRIREAQTRAYGSYGSGSTGVLEKRRREKELAKFWVITGTVRDTLQCINKLNHTEPLKIKFFSDIDSGISLNLRSGQKVGGKHKQLPQLSKKVGNLLVPVFFVSGIRIQIGSGFNQVSGSVS
jgi:hypothetical protein